MTFELLNFPSASVGTFIADRWVGAIGCGVFALAMVYLGACLVKTRFVTGWDKLTWVATGFLGMTFICGAGLLVSLIALVVEGDRPALALAGVMINTAGTMPLMWAKARRSLRGQCAPARLE